MITSHTVQANGLRMHYIRLAADKPQLLLLHGLTDNGGCWKPVIEALAGEYDIIAPDARGHGLTDAPGGDYMPAVHAADAAAFIQALGLDRPAVIGHSMGGATGAVLAARHPELVRAFVAEDPAWFDPNPLATPETRQQTFERWRDELRANKARNDAELLAFQHAKEPGWSEAELQPWRVAKRQVREEVLNYLQHEAFDWRGTLEKIQCPVLLVTGAVERGVIISPEQAKLAMQLNPRLRVANIPGTGHSIRRDGFEGYVEAVAGFLREVG